MTSSRITSSRSSPCWPWNRRPAPTRPRCATSAGSCSGRSAPSIRPRSSRGQYRGYTDEDGVNAGSDVEDFVALRLEIDSWRWAGVPWLIRTGKHLPVTSTEAIVEFNAPPRLLFSPPGARPPHPNHLRFRLGKDDGVMLHLQTKAPGDDLVSKPVDLEVSFDQVFGARQEAYQRLLEDAMVGDTRRFGRADAQDEQWRIFERDDRPPPPRLAVPPGRPGASEPPRRWRPAWAAGTNPSSGRSMSGC